MIKLLNILKLAVPTLVVALAVTYVAAQSSGWVAPTQTPPGGNAAAPINVGESTQSKLGSLRLNTAIPGLTYGLDVFGISRFFGNVEIGTTTSPKTIKIVDGNQGAGKVLTSDANGLASWAAGGGGGAVSATLFDLPVVIAMVDSSTAVTVTVTAGVNYSIPVGAKEIFIYGEVRSGYVRFRHPGQTNWKSFIERGSGEDYVAEHSGWLPLDSQGRIEISYAGLSVSSASVDKGLKIFGYR